MATLSTPIAVTPSEYLMEPGDAVVTLGSCFSTVLTRQLAQNAFPVLHNPFGTLYTPEAITTPLSLALHPEIHFTQEDLFEYDGVFHALSFSSRFHSRSPEKLLTSIHKITHILSDRLSKASHLVITLGTAWHYSLLSDHTSVGNCHRLSHTLFNREFTPVAAMVRHLSEALDEVTKAYPQLTIVLTISPVRHMRDNPLENSRSKAAVLLAAHEVAAAYERVEYFPSYEIMMDELRDYRYYSDDLVHPSSLAETLIFERFQQRYFSASARRFCKEYAPVTKARGHVLRTPGGAASFGKNVLRKISELQKKYPAVSFKSDEDYFSSLL